MSVSQASLRWVHGRLHATHTLCAQRDPAGQDHSAVVSVASPSKFPFFPCFSRSTRCSSGSSVDLRWWGLAARKSGWALTVLGQGPGVGAFGYGGVSVQGLRGVHRRAENRRAGPVANPSIAWVPPMITTTTTTTTTTTAQADGLRLPSCLLVAVGAGIPMSVVG